MRVTTLVLLLLGCGWWASGEPSRQPASIGAYPAHSTSADWWLQVLPEVNRKVAGERKKISEQWSPFQVSGGVGAPSVLVLPVPIPVSKKQSSQTECDAYPSEDEELEIDKSPRERPRGGPRMPAYVRLQPSSGRGSLRPQQSTEDEKLDVDDTPFERPYDGTWRPPNVASRPPLQSFLIPQQSSKGWLPNKPLRRPSKNNYENAEQTHLDFDRPPIDNYYDDVYLNSVRPSRPPLRQRPRPRPRLPPAREEQDAYEYEPPPLPKMTPMGTSQILVEAFREQQPSAPHLPPLLLPAYGDGERGPLRPVLSETDDSEDEDYPPIPPEGGVSTASFGNPPRPRFDRSLQLHGELTVHRADYTEPYTAWWDAESGSARVEYHNGSTTSYRTLALDGRVQRVEMNLNRVGPRDIWRCGVATPRRATPTDRAPPAIPDLELFSFDGFSEKEGARVERWRRVVAGSAGELGAARGEALTFNHEMLIRRKADGSTTPLRYLVSVDSSVLGADCDSYEHRYLSLRPYNGDVDFFSVDVETSCDEVEELDSGRREHFARLDPLYEFTQPQRDTRHDAVFERFKADYKRQYEDNVEEAVRKNLLMQTTRFVAAANRQGASSLHEVNFLADRLQAELRQLLGAVVDVDRTPSDPFPYESDTLRDVVQRIPRRFDWRNEGGVTHVRNQQDCLSCWAFAAVGAVEGALFARTRRLVPLSEQCLVDCGHAYGCHGCGGTWPNFAFDYVKSRGLPALEEYTPYQAKVLRCEDENVQPVTRISVHVNVTRNNPRALKVAIRRHGPTVVIIDGKPNSFTTYKEGVLYDDRCSKYNVNHALLAVGYGVHRLNRDKRLPPSVYFVLKNSWSTAWGEQGYIRLVGDTCGVLSKPSYPIIEDTDIKYVPSTSAVRPSPSDASGSRARVGGAKPRRTRVRTRVRGRVHPRQFEDDEPIDN